MGELNAVNGDWHWRADDCGRVNRFFVLFQKEGIFRIFLFIGFQECGIL